VNSYINNIAEDKIINGGFLAVSLAIVLSSLFKPVSGFTLASVVFCTIGIIPLAFNSFVIEYKKRFSIDVKHWSYELMVFVGFIATFIGLFVALFVTNHFLAYAFILGFFIVIPCYLYLDKLVKANKDPNKKLNGDAAKDAAHVS